MRTLVLPLLFAVGCTTDVLTDPGDAGVSLPLQASEVSVRAQPGVTDSSYELSMQGHTVRLDLTQVEAPFTPGYTEFRVERGVRTEVAEAERADAVDCWYRGTVSIDGRPVPNGVAAVRTCTATQTDRVDGMLLLDGDLWSVDGSSGTHILAPVPAVEIDRIAALGREMVDASAIDTQFGPPGAPAWVELAAVNDSFRAADVANPEAETALIVHGTTALYLPAGSRPVRMALTSQTTFVGSDPWVATRVGSEVDVDSLLDLFTTWTESDPSASVADHATLFSTDDFDGSTIGYAGVGTMCGGRSTSLVETNGNTTRDAATTAHEIGHSFGMIHDGTGACGAFPSSGFIMAAVLGFQSPTEFSGCSVFTLDNTLDATTCLDNEPGPVFTAVTCGNGIVEAGEACDCAGPDCSLIDPCCDGSTCQLTAGATCSALDACCDESTCGVVPASAAQVCREADDLTCDTPETCNGLSSTCPGDVSAAPGTTCDNNGSCLLGTCASVVDQCNELGNTFTGVFYDPSCQFFMDSNPCGPLICGTSQGFCSSFTFNGSQVLIGDGSSCGTDSQCFEGTCQASDDLPDNSGCPDSDGDGVCDTDDVCPGVDDNLDADGDGITACAGDCDDLDPAAFPGAAEICDGIDNDCDGSDDEGFDTDNDGFTTCGGDCDDTVASVNPGAPEVCDGVDNDCDLQVDESFDGDNDGFTTCGGDCDDTTATVAPGAPEVCDGVDNDCDLQIDEGLSVDADGDGFTAPGSCQGEGDDCDDAVASTNPGATEVCDGVDNDCANGPDDGLTVDADSDGFTAPGSCAGSANDCDDGVASTNPGAPEVCDGVDNDCDGSTDEGLTIDADNDGFTSLGSCSGTADDCDDANASTNPGAAEICDGSDNDCDGSADEGLTLDADGDGFTAPGSCTGDGDDCDDADGAINPDATEVCDNVDNDCDAQTDEGLTLDADGDGFTAPGSCTGNEDDCDDADNTVNPDATEVCDSIDNDCDAQTDEGLTLDADGDGFTAPGSCTGNEDDCDDADDAINPDATELCDGLDNDCDAQTDEGLTVDADGDGFSAPGSCEGSSDDCDDAVAATNPGATETCDTVDNDCDGDIDEGLSTDADGDGFTALGSCLGSGDDCDDADNTLNPGAAELCDGVDNDCDLVADEGLTLDADGDGFTAPGSCEGSADDCDDAVAGTNPGATETCDGLDNDCDGDVDEGLTLDADQDGFTAPGSCEGSADDCDDAVASTNPGATEVCDNVDNDCDGTPDEGLSLDADGDGFTAPGSCEGSADDCDDADDTTNPDATEACDGLDNNCDGQADEGLTLDVDGDGYTSLGSCEGSADDCDDATAGTHPDATEVCDGVDNDCDAQTDEGLTFDTDGDGFTAPGSCSGGADDCDDAVASTNPGAAEVCDGADNDCDGQADEGLTLDADGDGFTAPGSCAGNGDDCDDADDAIQPGATELCDGVDNDCDGTPDEGLTTDADGDGFTAPGSCAGNGDDCDDAVASTNPGALEVCDGIDNDCDGTPDEGLTTDADADGFTAPGSCAGNGDDCDDGAASTNPGAAEVCDGVDNDCDGTPDEGLSTDADGDGFTAPGSCSGNGDDCDDVDEGINPGAAEVCDGVDNDCDGSADEGLSTDADNDGYTSLGSCEGSADDCNDADGAIHPDASEICNDLDDNCTGGIDEGLTTDADGDGFSSLGSCAGTADDCDDAAAATNPGATELCDGVDNDCDGGADEGLTADADGDGFTSLGSCEGSADDCADDDDAVHPGAPEVCDTIDNDCDGQADEGLTLDADGDGFTSLGSCAGSADDCDDGDDTTNPGAAETCDGLDNDCDGALDEGLTFDADGDGFTAVGACTGSADDCDDGDAAAFPGAFEVCDGVDNDCDAVVDEGLTLDADGDGFTDPASCSGSMDDCDDGDPLVFPGAQEVCNGVDDNCSGAADEGLTFDLDGDGFSALGSCAGTGDDCNDASASTNPGAVELCDGLDNDCDGALDEGLTTDADSDGFTAPGSCEGDGDDCDDADPNTNPGATEICNGFDDNCSGAVDEGLSTDADNDGFTSLGSCGGTADDCDDAVAAINPGAAELCDGLDNNCSGAADEGLTIDADGDGFTSLGSCAGSADDCDDGAAATNPGATEICDGADNDCDGDLDEGLTTDADNDGFTAPGSCAGSADDCDDADDTTNPGASEVCDGADNDCDGTPDEGLTTDADGDGFTSPGSCTGSADDCDDADAATNVGASEVCDGADNNCSGVIDEGLTTDADGDGYTSLGSCEGSADDCDDAVASTNPDAAEVCNNLDDDCDGTPDEGLTTDADGDGFTDLGSCAGTADDCDDAVASTNPTAPELCNDVDDNCSGAIDEGLTTDADGDGFTAPGSCAGTADDCDDGVATTNPGAVETCNGIDDDCDGSADDGLDVDADGDGFVSLGSCNGGTDCDDADPNTNPDATETCNGLDDNCDGSTDEGLSTDADGDGFTALGSCEGSADDCDDADDAINADATETCDGVDNDCDGALDEGLTLDADGDGFTAPGSCEGSADDCDDADDTTNPGAAEVCDGVDNNCSGAIDEGLSLDADADGYTAVGSCAGTADDCDDLSVTINPGAAETCNELDDDCDGMVDNGLSLDVDGDGFLSAASCGGGDDCNDLDDTINPDATEVCDGLDNNCSGLADEGLTTDADGDGFTALGSCAGSGDDCDDGVVSTNPGAAETCNGVDDDCDGSADEGLDVDADGDGFLSALSCGGGDDCDDADPNTNPGAVELCNGADDNCSGAADEGLTTDADGDGFTSPGSCAGSGDDCDDGAASTNPGAAETCNGVDDDCDGTADDGLDVDADGDGFLSVASCSGGDDCDDGAANVNPGATETCNGVDDNCDGSADEGLTTDADGDGFTAPGSCEGAGDDCDDADASANPGATETCNGIDDNCSGLIDEGLDIDADGDGYLALDACGGGTDCDDADPTTNPGALETCNGTDDNCSGDIDEGFDVDGDGLTTCAGDNCPTVANADQSDLDGDTLGDVCDDDDDGDTVADVDDTDPTDASVCADVDGDTCDDCSLGLPDPANDGVDGDADGICDAGDACLGDDATGDADNDGVCDDLDACVGSDASGDTDGDGVCDSDDLCQGDDATGDVDADGFCGNEDCDDADDAVSPDAAEVCDDAIDNNCDGEVDESCDTATCGDGALEPLDAAPACTNSRYLSVYSRSDLDAWLANPTRSVDIRASIDFGGADLTIATQCRVRTRADLTGLGDVTISGGTVDIGRDLIAAGDVRLTGLFEVDLWSSSFITGSSLTMEAQYVLQRADMILTGDYCTEGVVVDLNRRSYLGALDSSVEVFADGVYLDADIVDAASVDVVADEIAMASAGDITGISGDVSLVASSSLYVNGDPDGVGGALFLQADEIYLDSSAWLEAGAVDIVATLLTQYGDIRSSGEVVIDVSEDYGVGYYADIRANGDIDIDVAGLFVSEASFRDNGHITIDAGEYLLYAAHEFTGNSSCVLTGTPDPASATANTCTEQLPNPEICDDGIDNDGDGEVDEDCGPVVCPSGEVPDCGGVCWPESWLADGYCDDGTVQSWGDPDFNCAVYNFDEGDCTDTCPDGTVEDCNGSCFPVSWIGDGACDDGTVYPWGNPDFFCPMWNDDDGDCAP